MDTPAINPYPTEYKLPGDKSILTKDKSGDDRQSLLGPKACIVHALTFHEIPPKIDQLIEKLPDNEKLEELPNIQKEYLSFTVYSLKQMVAAGTISAETAWSLFYGEWGKIDSVAEDNFKGMREAFMQGVKTKIGDNDSTKKLSLLEFEFYARAGKAGLAQYERYDTWAKDLIFDKYTCKGMSEATKDEYRKALWLEMRIIEKQIGISKLNEDVRIFELGDGKYHIQITGITGTIDLFKVSTSSQSGRAIDSTIKAEIGHWMFGVFNFNNLWPQELMDRMNIIGYTERVNVAFDNTLTENLPPEARAFLQGGFYLASREADYSNYPEELPESKKNSYEKHEVAEYVERLIRKRMIRAVKGKELSSKDVYKTYRKMGVYIALLDFERKTKEEILEKIESFNLKEIDEYYNSYKIPWLIGEGKWEEVIKLGEAAIPALEEKLIDEHSRKEAAEALIKLKGLKEGSPKYKELYAYLLIDEGKWEEVIKLGKYASFALVTALYDENQGIRAKAAKALGEIGDIFAILTKEYKRLYAYQLIEEGKWEEVIKLGEAAIPALKITVFDESIGEKAAEALKKIRQMEAEE